MNLKNVCNKRLEQILQSGGIEVEEWKASIHSFWRLICVNITLRLQFPCGVHNFAAWLLLKSKMAAKNLKMFGNDQMFSQPMSSYSSRYTVTRIQKIYSLTYLQCIELLWRRKCFWKVKGHISGSTWVKFLPQVCQYNTLRVNYILPGTEVTKHLTLKQAYSLYKSFYKTNILRPFSTKSSFENFTPYMEPKI